MSPASETADPVFHPPALALLRRLGGDKLVRDIIDVFARAAPVLLATARAGVESGDAAAVGRALHSLKSSAGQLGAARLQRLCNEGEQLAARGPNAELSVLVNTLDGEFAQATVSLDAARRAATTEPQTSSASP